MLWQIKFAGQLYTMEKNSNQWKDGLGIIASVTCAIHCAATPILLAFLPALKFTEWMASPIFHQAAAVVCASIVSLAIWPAFMRFRDYRVLTLSTAGLGLLIAAAFFLPDECCSHSLASVSSTDTSTDLHAGHNHPTDVAHNHDSLNHDLDESTPSSSSLNLLNSAQPWMTPLGGLLLVLAHGLNLRRRICSGNNCECGSGRASSFRQKETNPLFGVSTNAA